MTQIAINMSTCIQMLLVIKWEHAYSKELNGAQKYTVRNRKTLLAIVPTFKECRSTFLGAQLTDFTNHKNLTCENLQTQWALRWRLFFLKNMAQQ